VRGRGSSSVSRLRSEIYSWPAESVDPKVQLGGRFETPGCATPGDQKRQLRRYFGIISSAQKN